MRHALILSTLRLPLIAAVCLCCFVVAVTAFTRFPLQSDRTVPDVEFGADSDAANRGTARPTERPVGKRTDAETELPTTDFSPVSAIRPEIVHADSIDRDEPEVHGVAADKTVETGGQNIPIKSLVTRIDGFLRGRIDDLADAAKQLANPDASDESSTTDNIASKSALASRPNSNVGAVSNGQEIVLINPAANGLRVSFLLDQQVVVLDPGANKTIQAKRIFVRFDLGGGRGSESRSLSTGRYEFRLTSAGWELQPKAQ